MRFMTPGVVMLGVDPGKSGAISAMAADGFGFIKNDRTEADIAEWLRAVTYKYKEAFAYLEQVHAMPGQGVTSMFTFGTSYGFLRGLLIGLGVPFTTVTPQRWQKRLSCTSGGDKNVTKAKAQELFPHIKVTHANADAFLLAEYGWRVYHDGDA